MAAISTLPQVSFPVPPKGTEDPTAHYYFSTPRQTWKREQVEKSGVESEKKE